jgi:hypothetical protein
MRGMKQKNGIWLGRSEPSSVDPAKGILDWERGYENDADTGL